MWEVFEMLLKRDGVSIADVSRATGISQPVFSNWKKRRGKISAENAESDKTTIAKSEIHRQVLWDRELP